MIHAVLFDLYDTLLYVDNEAFDRKIATCAKAVGVSPDQFRQAWFSVSLESNLGRFGSIIERVEAVLRELRCKRGNGIASSIAESERSFLRVHIHAFPDAADTLLALRGNGTKLAIVTNASLSVRGVLKGSGLQELVDVVVISSEVMAVKPDPKIYTQALELLNVIPPEACFVGDGNDRELDGARAVGMRTVLVRRERERYGLRESSTEAAADAIVQSLAGVTQVIRQLAM
jgi:putative hydrolase of the HAD superfamily